MRIKKEGLYDFRSFGQAIKRAREAKGWMRDQVAEMVHLAPRYLMSIENQGQHPSFQSFYELMTLLHISVDEFLFPDTECEKTTRRRQLDELLNELDDKDLTVMTATAKGLMEAKTEETEG